MPRHLYDITPLEPLLADGWVVLTPNLRLARRIKAEWDAGRAGRGERAWERVAVQPLESWLMQQWEQALAQGLVPPLTPISAGQALALWEQAIAADERQSGTYHLLRPAGAAQLCSQARDNLLRWQVDPEDGRVRQDFGMDMDSATFLRWHGLFEQRLAAAGLGTSTDCIRALLSGNSGLSRARVILLEFDDIPPLYRAAAAALCEEVRELRSGGTPGRRQAHAFEDKRAELQAVARWAAAINRADPAASVGVVLTDMAADRGALEYLMRAEFDCLGDAYASLPVNFSTGVPLAGTPLVSAALAALALGRQRTTVPAVVGLLSSRFLRLPDADSELANAFVTRLFEAGQEELDMGELRYAASQVTLGEAKGLVLGERLMTLARMRELRRIAPPSAWVERFCAVLECLGWPGTGALDSLEFQQAGLWYRTLEEFAGYDVVCPRLDYEAALQLLASCCSRQMSQPQTEDSNVQVLGPLEAAGLAFDHLWLCGLRGGSWPAPARPNPFIPHRLQRERQMPHASAEREWAYAVALMDGYQLATADLHASYARQTDGVAESPSALLEDFSWEPFEPGIAESGAQAGSRWLQQWQQRSLEWVEDHRAPPLTAAELAATGGGAGLLEDQSHCPFRAFAHRRLKVEALGDFGVALSPAERGSLLHEALYVLWGEIADHARLLGLESGALDAVIARAVDAGLQSVPARRRRALGSAYWELEGRHLARLLGEWLQVERERAAFVVCQRETEVNLELEQLQLRLRVDRVDELPDGSRVIIDYKTGSSSVGDWLGDRPARPQLLLYGIAEPGGASALAFAQLRPRDCKYVGLGAVRVAAGIQTDIPKAVKNRMDALDWESLNRNWRDTLQRLAAAFVAGDARVDPLGPASCTWCGLQPLCRVDFDQAGAT